MLLLVILGLNYNKTNLSYFNLKTHLNGDIGEEALELGVTSSLLKHYALQEKVLELRKANNEIIHEILRKKLLNQNGTSEFVWSLIKKSTIGLKLTQHSDEDWNSEMKKKYKEGASEEEIQELKKRMNALDQVGTDGYRCRRSVNVNRNGLVHSRHFLKPV